MCFHEFSTLVHQTTFERKNIRINLKTRWIGKETSYPLGFIVLKAILTARLNLIG